MKKELEIMRAEIFRGRQHKLVFLELEENGQIVSEIMRKVNPKIKEGKELRLREVSRALKWLAEQKYAECLNPSKKQGVKGIIYRLSKEGKKIKRTFNQ
jgi:predicted transcriptional regulator